MSAATTSFYVTGGTLRHDAPSYVERQADWDLYAGLSRGEFCYVLHSRQMGKSSLMARAAARLRQEGVAVVVFDLTALGRNLSADQWYGGLLLQVGSYLDLEDELAEYWLEQAHVGPLQRWLRALREVVLPRCPERIVIFIDEIDAVRSLPFSTDEFFASIRECYNRRSEDSEFERLAFCLLGVATPSDLIQDVRTTPFNIGRRIEPTDFSAAEVASLAEGLGRKGRTAARLMERVLYWTGGHPYLTQRLCQVAAEDARVVDAAGVDRLCEALFLSPSARERDDNLLFVRDRLLRSEVDLPALLDLYAQVRRGRRVRNDEANPLVSLLRLAGITCPHNQEAGGDGTLRVRNRIYARVFDREWVRTHMPDAELRRQREAYRRGMVQTAALASLVAAVVGGLAVYAFQQKHVAGRNFRLASAKTVEANRNLYFANVNLIQSNWESGNVNRILGLLADTRGYSGRGFEWGYWNRLCHLDLRTLSWPSKSVRSVSFLPDGRAILTGSYAEAQRPRYVGMAKVWDAASGREMRTFTGHAGWVVSVNFSPDGRRIVTGSSDTTAKVWDAHSGRETLTLKGHSKAVGYAGFSADGRRIVTGSSDTTAKVWDAASGRETLTLRGHIDRVNSVRFSPDGRRILTSSWDNTTKVWDAEGGREALTLKGHAGTVLSVCFSPDGRRIVTGREDNTARLWDAQSGRETLALKGHTGSVWSVSFSPDGGRIVTGSGDHTAKVWFSEDGNPPGRVPGRDAP